VQSKAEKRLRDSGAANTFVVAIKTVSHRGWSIGSLIGKYRASGNLI